MTTREYATNAATALVEAERDLYDGYSAVQLGRITKDQWTDLAKRCNTTIRENGSALAHFVLMVVREKEAA